MNLITKSSSSLISNLNLIKTKSSIICSIKSITRSYHTFGSDKFDSKFILTRSISSPMVKDKQSGLTSNKNSGLSAFKSLIGSTLSSFRSLKSASSLKSIRSIGSNSVYKMKIIPIKALSDNYMYLLIDEATRQAACIDPVNASAMSSVCYDQNADLKLCLTTHHHHDHAGGNRDMVRMFPDLIVYGGDGRIPELEKRVNHGDTIKLGTLTIECLSTPCHTKGHICYYVTSEPDPESSLGSSASASSPAATSTLQSGTTTTTTNNNNTTISSISSNSGTSPPPPPPTTITSNNNSSTNVEKAVFTGDTLFIAGCGRFFEGTSEQMDHNLNQILGSLPADTKVYCGHEYTVTNLKFALSVEPSNMDIKGKLQWAQNRVARREPTVPSTIGEEKKINPFMRIKSPSVRKFAGETDDLEVMSVLRQRKNEFQPT